MDVYSLGGVCIALGMFCLYLLHVLDEKHEDNYALHRIVDGLVRGELEVSKEGGNVVAIRNTKDGNAVGYVVTKGE